VGSWKTTLALVLVLAGLGAYIYFVDSKKPVGDPAKEKAFTGVTLEDIEELEIKSESGERSRVRKSDGQWRLVEPVAADADQGELTAIANALPDLEIQRVVEENPPDLKRYGLEMPRIEVGFRKKGSKDFNRLKIGDRTPTGNELYAQTPDSKRVILLGSSIDGTFNKPTFALRDKSVLQFERDKVTSLELSSKSGDMQFVKSGTEWRIVKPIAARADFGVVEGIIERLHSLQMQNIVAPDGAANPANYGLDKPTGTITIGSGSARATLLLGSTRDAVINAKDASRPMIFTLAPTITMDVFKALSDVRRGDVFDSRAFTATHVEFRRGEELIVLDKTKGKDEKESWKDGAGKEVDATKADDLLNRMLGLRASSFDSTAPASLKSPQLTVTVRYDESKMETVRFARDGNDVVAARSDEPGAGRIMTAAFDEAVKALDAVK
jgi:Domain of unknown function (DUF4340)